MCKAASLRVDRPLMYENKTRAPVLLYIGISRKPPNKYDAFKPEKVPDYYSARGGPDWHD